MGGSSRALWRWNEVLPHRGTVRPGASAGGFMEGEKNTKAGPSPLALSGRPLCHHVTFSLAPVFLPSPYARREALPERTTRSLCPPQGCSRSGEPVPITPRLLRLQPGPPPSTPMMSSYSRLHPAATCGVGRCVRDHRPPSHAYDTMIHRGSWEPLSHRADRGKGGRDQVPLAGLLW